MAKAKKRSAAEIAAAMLAGSAGAKAASAGIASAKGASAKGAAATKNAPVKSAATKNAPVKSAATKGVATKGASRRDDDIPSLKELGKLADEGAWPRVLGGLLEAWRAAPNRRLGDAIVAVGELVQQKLADWDAAAATGDPTAVTALLDTLLDDGSISARERLVTLTEWPADPRIDRWVAERYVEVPYTSTGARPFWTRMVPLGVKVRDPAASARLADARKKYKTDHFITPYLERIRKAIGEPEDAPLVDEKAVAAVEAAVRAQAERAKPANAADIDALLATVLAKPDDEAARLVLRDALLEAEHPRGELMALQATGADRRREKAIIEAHGDELLGPLADALKDYEFANGFITRAALKQSNAGVVQAAIAKSVGHPLWATVEHLEGGGDYDVAKHPVMRSLRSLANTDADTAWLAKHPRLASLTGERVHAKWLATATADGAFPALRELAARANAQEARTLLGSALVTRLDKLTLRVGLLSTYGWAEPPRETAFELLDALPKIREVELRFVRHEDKDWGIGVRFVRDRNALAAHVFATKMRDNWETQFDADVPKLIAAIGKLRPANVVLEHGFATPGPQKQLVDGIRSLGGTVA